jgi:protein phosphatase
MEWFIWYRNEKHPVHFAARSHAGKIRGENQDSYGWFPENLQKEEMPPLFVVADGMGGYTRGSEASRTAVEVVRETYASGGGTIFKRLKRAFTAANERIHALAQKGDEGGRMGTTCTALVLENARIHIAHVGDTRAYRINSERIEQLTRDHTVVDELRQEQVLTASEVRNHPQRHLLTRALGIALKVEIDVSSSTLQENDRILLSTDGLASMPEEEIQRTVLSAPPEEACEKLIDRANERDGADNVTVLVIHYRGAP